MKSGLGKGRFKPSIYLGTDILDREAEILYLGARPSPSEKGGLSPSYTWASKFVYVGARLATSENGKFNYFIYPGRDIYIPR